MHASTDLDPAVASEQPQAQQRRPAIVAVDDEPAVLAAVARDLRRGFGERFRILRASSGPRRSSCCASCARAAIRSRC